MRVKEDLGTRLDAHERSGARGARRLLLGVVLLSLCVLFSASPPSRFHFGDFSAYWTAGRAFLEGRNPYDPRVLEDLAASHGLRETFVLWNPPWTFALLVPFAMLPFGVAGAAWCALNVVLLLVAARLIGPRVGLPDFWSMVLGITFLPAVICLGISQWSILVLAGAVLYVDAIDRGRPALAGAALALCATKPHLVGLLWLTPILLDGGHARRGVFLGLAGALGVMTAGALVWHPGLAGAFVGALRHPPETPPFEFFSATLGTWVRVELAGDRAAWIQFVPFLVALVWFIRRYRRGREGEPFPRTCAIALFVSALALPYGWHYDQTTLLPVYLWLWGLTVWPGARRIPDWRRAAIIAGLVTFELGMAAMVGMRTPERYYVVWPWLLAGLAWTTPREMRLLRHERARCAPEAPKG